MVEASISYTESETLYNNLKITTLKRVRKYVAADVFVILAGL